MATGKQDEPLKNPWSGRFESSVHPVVQRFTRSIQVDCRLAAQDLRGSRAHVRMLGAQGIIAADEVVRILEGLASIERELEAGTFPFRDELEDIHMNIEHRLRELIGEVGEKLHSGRSRNDQVALDLRLYCREAAGTWRLRIIDCIQLLQGRAQEYRCHLFPGWTHLQAAQPLSWAHYLLGFAEMLARDDARLESYLRLHSLSPLGAGALSGSSLPLDPEATARELGFKGSFDNSYDAVGDRDALLELSQIATQLMIHLSRLSEDFIYLSSTPVGWLELPDALCTGSSMMPQKKNPDLLELTRGKCASVIGHSTGLAVLLKGLPSSYHRDLQQDKEHLFPIVDIVTDALDVQRVLLEGFSIQHERASAVLERGFLMATELAEYLVGRGVPFRSAHRRVGELVKQCLDAGIRLDECPLEQIRTAIPECGDDVISVLSPEAAVERRRHKGSTGLSSIDEQLRRWEDWIRQRKA